MSEQAKIAHLEQEIKQAGINRNAFIIVGVVSILLCVAVATQIPHYWSYYDLMVSSLLVGGLVIFIACLSASNYYYNKRRRLMNELYPLGTAKPSRTEKIIIQCSFCGKELVKGDFEVCPFCGNPM